MPTTTVLHVSQADIDYTIRSVETWDDVQAIAKFVGIDKADTCSRVYVSGQNDPSIELKLLPETTLSDKNYFSSYGPPKKFNLTPKIVLNPYVASFFYQ